MAANTFGRIGEQRQWQGIYPGRAILRYDFSELLGLALGGAREHR
jgi:hypothetical protein